MTNVSFFLFLIFFFHPSRGTHTENYNGNECKTWMLKGKNNLELIPYNIGK